ncbi:hypothetical protein HELRODRAFT_158581 [Helobdella robusta]|uniref:Uncharacterized protein n=1 Tax=Helobdella robusta TaxID=6412 RepID=T1EMZ1_HELRO|nr:hypothetical protein HELRODRAFT_158581 [Helobdella robusta]ESO12136.1 hypothetical protein HELRODRAFT_158581 [Helobdella robusta]
MLKQSNLMKFFKNNNKNIDDNISFCGNEKEENRKRKQLGANVDEAVLDDPQPSGSVQTATNLHDIGNYVGNSMTDQEKEIVLKSLGRLLKPTNSLLSLNGVLNFKCVGLNDFLGFHILTKKRERFVNFVLYLVGNMWEKVLTKKLGFW